MFYFIYQLRLLVIFFTQQVLVVSNSLALFLSLSLREDTRENRAGAEMRDGFSCLSTPCSSVPSLCSQSLSHSATDFPKDTPPIKAMRLHQIFSVFIHVQKALNDKNIIIQ